MGEPRRSRACSREGTCHGWLSTSRRLQLARALATRTLRPCTARLAENPREQFESRTRAATQSLERCGHASVDTDIPRANIGSVDLDVVALGLLHRLGKLRPDNAILIGDGAEALLHA